MNVIRIGKDVHLNTVFQLSCSKWSCLFKKKMQRNSFPVQLFDAWGSSLVRQHLRQEGFKVAVRSQGQVISSDINAYIIDTIGWSSASVFESGSWIWKLLVYIPVSGCPAWNLDVIAYEHYYCQFLRTVTTILVKSCLRWTQEFLFFGTSGFCGRFSCPRPGWPQFSWTCSCRVRCSYRYYWMEWPYIW